MILQRKATGRIRTLEVYTTIPFTYTFFYYLRKIYFSKLLNDYFVPYITVIYTCFFSRVCITEGWKICQTLSYWENFRRMTCV